MNLRDEERSKLLGLQDKGYFHHLKRFDFTKYPKFWDINKSRGEYAWKAGMINEVADEFPGALLWMDSGNRVFPHFLRKAVRHIEEHGFWSPSSSGTVRDYTHPGVFDFFKDSIEKYSNLRNCNGALIGLNSENRTIMNTVIRPFRECALRQDCIAPKGSSRANHRQDQSILTYLAHINGWRCSSEGWSGYLIHQDADCEERVQEHDSRLSLGNQLKNI
ncbi:hypothetical protein K493DRAFT_208957 [Basidiobolus meristosporus CBS 931.73]|uniref:Uncharacterized protein n=1 Tax=Basidiobolus meristosporus CBS 931.73 TaxID=1314790 RepID=A0A1Y1YVH5_9FUNG|nr:hypothetical protein K493DRAFT_208957 [Basidiobolus meristosporus CBS 931.73]|eukprot:ORY01959.1 hypothetical protein K493DRAFT_208957 [Basidiobolus meristosporus CBS 931.73]